MKALILAAGLGTRLRPYTEHTPKPLFTLAGRPLLDVLINQLVDAGCTAVIINTHHLPETITAHVAKSTYRAPVQVRHEPDILGTAGAIRNVADFWDHKPFMVINGDIFTDIDLRQVYSDHCRQRQVLTLVLYDYPAINSVAVNSQGHVCGFQGYSSDLHPAETTGIIHRTFTGIQVVNPELLKFIPAERFADSVSWYRQLLDLNVTIQARVEDAAHWTDLGTPQTYRKAARTTLALSAFETVHTSCEPAHITFQPLAGDASDRQWYRLACGRQTLILGDHGIRPHLEVCEADAFVAIGRHLLHQGVKVPAIYAQDTFAGLVIMEDLGDCHLQKWVHQAPTASVVTNHYSHVFDGLLKLAIQGYKGFQTTWTYQSPAYDFELILEKECRYFVEAFVQDYLGDKVDYEHLHPEFCRLADMVLTNSLPGLIHRDCQSRNIMVHRGAYYFIDFQGARPGPIQYDLASLLIDPYTALPQALQTQLQALYLKNLAAIVPVDHRRWRYGYAACCLTRLLQMLGAFGFLSKRKGKTQFATYIPTALATLNQHLLQEPQFPRLQSLVEKLVRTAPQGAAFHRREPERRA